MLRSAFWVGLRPNAKKSEALISNPKFPHLRMAPNPTPQTSEACTPFNPLSTSSLPYLPRRPKQPSHQVPSAQRASAFARSRSSCARIFLRGTARPSRASMPWIWSCTRPGSDVQGLGFGVWGLGLGVWGLGFRVRASAVLG